MSKQQEPPAEGAEPTLKKGPKGVVLIGSLVGALVIGAAAGLFALGPTIARRSGFVVRAHAAADGSAGEGEDAPAEEAHASEKKDGEVATSNVHLIDNLVLNPAGSGGSRFLMLAAAVEFSDASMVEEMKARDSEARDVVLRVMGAKTVEELADPANRELLKTSLADSLGALFEKKKAVRRLYFPQFVIQ